MHQPQNPFHPGYFITGDYPTALSWIDPVRYKNSWSSPGHGLKET